MNNKILVLAGACVIGAAAYGGYWFGMNRNMQVAAPPGNGKAAATAAGATQGAGPVDPATGRKVLYWHDPMVPGQKFDKPGKSPFMDMQLVPVYADNAGEEGGVTISPRVQQNLGVRTAEVTTGSIAQKLEAVGSVAYNERAVALVTARANGYVERLYVRAPLDPVRKGQPLADVFVPDWVAAQEEYLSVRRMQEQGTDALVAGARQRMLIAGMNEEQIHFVESAGKVHPRFTLSAPIDGVIAELGAREGMTVAAGAMLFRLNGLGSVWVNAEIPESSAALIRPGNVVEVRTPVAPERVLKGRVAAILPEVNPATRTLKARVEVPNVGGLLAPGMFANVSFTPSGQAGVLLVPTEAVIQTGARKVVVVAQEGGRFQPVDVETGADANGQTVIRKGLAAGQKVVVSGQFLIDSEASLKATTTRMTDAPMAKDAPPPSYHADGRVEAIGKDAVTISHGPIPALQWGAMTMEFKTPAAGLPKNIAKGDSVTFEFRQRADGQFEVIAISPVAQPPAATRGMSK
jgi:Cu(I)/Ag(I) efflux system membrane fusion protein